MKRKLTKPELNAGADFLINYMKHCKSAWDNLNKHGYEFETARNFLELKETQADFLLGEINIELYKGIGENLENAPQIDKIFVDNFVNTLKLALGSSSEEKISLHTLSKA